MSARFAPARSRARTVRRCSGRAARRGRGGLGADVVRRRRRGAASGERVRRPRAAGLRAGRAAAAGGAEAERRRRAAGTAARVHCVLFAPRRGAVRGAGRGWSTFIRRASTHLSGRPGCSSWPPPRRSARRAASPRRLASRSATPAASADAGAARAAHRLRGAGVRVGAQQHADRGARRRRRGRPRRHPPARPVQPLRRRLVRAAALPRPPDRRRPGAVRHQPARPARHQRRARRGWRAAAVRRRAAPVERRGRRCWRRCCWPRQRFFIHLSRTGYHYVDTPLLSLLALWLFLRLWQDRRLGAAVWCGIALGLGIQTYYASRLVPLLLGAHLGALAARHAARRSARGASRRSCRGHRSPRWRSRRRCSATSLTTGARSGSARATPACSRQAQSRPSRLRLRHREPRSPSSLIQLRAALTLFNLDAGQLGAVRLPRAAARAGERACCSSSASAWCWRSCASAAPSWSLLWTVLPLIAGAALTIDTPFYPRISGLVPFAVLLVALALHALLRRCAPRSPGRAGTLAGRRRSPSAALAWIVADNLRTYFVDYAPRYRHLAVGRDRRLRAPPRRRQDDLHGRRRAGVLHPPRRHRLPHLRLRDARHRRPRPLPAQRDARPGDERSSSSCRRAPTSSRGSRRRSGRSTCRRIATARGGIAFLTAIPQSVARHGPIPRRCSSKRHEPGPGVTAARPGLRLDRRARRGGVLIAAGRRCRRAGPRGSALRRPRRARRHRPGGAAGASARALARGPPVRPGRDTSARATRRRAGSCSRRCWPDSRRRRRPARLPPRPSCPPASSATRPATATTPTPCCTAGRDETGARCRCTSGRSASATRIRSSSTPPMLPMALLGPTELAVRLTAALYGSGDRAGDVLPRPRPDGAAGRPARGAAARRLPLAPALQPHRLRADHAAVLLHPGLTSLVRWTQGRRTLAPAAVLFGLCLYTYVPAKLFVPLFLAGVALLYRRALRARWRETALAAAAAGADRRCRWSIFDVTHREQRAATSPTPRSSPATSRRRAGAAVRANYAAFFSPRVPLRSQQRPHHPPQRQRPRRAVLVLRAAAAARRRSPRCCARDRALRLPLLWLALYPVAAALMNEIPSASRGIHRRPGLLPCSPPSAPAAVLRLADRGSPARARVAWALQGALVAAGLAVLVPAAQRYWALYRDEYPLVLGQVLHRLPVRPPPGGRLLPQGTTTSTICCC